mmetsp:Transcript_28978/g.97743  ORF Transcript_28978/g.97743 Transcript_28978/m.97743 type:complete len:236 (+) Transcript_28978:3770-4477(+)
MDCTRSRAFFSMSLNTSGSATPPVGHVGGPSSKIFWKRRCVEQSRPDSAIALPHSSPTTWTSKWRAPVTSCITKTGDPGTSDVTCGQELVISSASAFMRMPLPPPPSEALSMTGYPIRSAAASADSKEVTQAASNVDCGMVPSSLRRAWRGPSSSGLPQEPDQGMDGTLAVCARMLAAILSPSTAITEGGGPMKAMFAAIKARGSFGFSEAWPHPGQTASTPASMATSTMSLTLA